MTQRTWRALLESEPDYFEASCGKGATEAQILAAEQKLKLSLPPSYRAFLAEVGWAEVSRRGGGFAIAGLGKDVPADLGLVEITLAARKEGIPATLLPVIDEGDHLFLDLSTPQGAVVLLEDGQPEELAPSFGDWLAEELSE